MDGTYCKRMLHKKAHEKSHFHLEAVNIIVALKGTAINTRLQTKRFPHSKYLIDVSSTDFVNPMAFLLAPRVINCVNVI